MNTQTAALIAEIERLRRQIAELEALIAQQQQDLFHCHG